VLRSLLPQKHMRFRKTYKPQVKKLTALACIRQFGCPNTKLNFIYLMRMRFEKPHP
jgi:hypothetical protein